MKSKFRAIYKPDKAKIMFYLEWVEKENDMFFVAENDPECMYKMGHVFHDDDWIVESGIGLEDQHGIKIYNGDKVYIDHPCWREEAEVRFLNGSFVFVVKSNQAIIPGWTIEKETWKLKVIGTIRD